MQVLQFIAPNAASALAQIQKQLGPDAVVLSVRPLPVQGVARFLPKSRRIEVLAGVPDETSAADSAVPALFPDSESEAPIGGQTPLETGNHQSEIGNEPRRWQGVAWLEAMGLLPANAERLQKHLAITQSASPPASLEAEWAAISTALSHFWRPAPPLEDGLMARPHVFIGPPGSGKTTALCKWLTLASLMEERPARVFRLDGNSANTADYLTIHCEMLGAPLERFWSQPGNRAELIFVDLPGVEAHDATALNALRSQIATLPNPHIHLVLNAAYETTTLLAQWRAFSVLQPHDMIFTHLDEEVRRVKLWNLVFGTDTAIRFLSAGQKIPGEFLQAAPELLFPSEGVR